MALELNNKFVDEMLLQQRGKMKEEEFVKKIQEIMIEEEKQRIPIAQGLPWTTDEPEVGLFCCGLELTSLLFQRPRGGGYLSSLYRFGGFLLLLIDCFAYCNDTFSVLVKTSCQRKHKAYGPEAS